MPGVPDAVAADLLKEVMKVPLKKTTKDDNEWHRADEILFSKR
tara:strand:+ start:584 stop:712 length:129 start_codon:yes stop_codon:yes gene_type:complete